MADQFEGPLSAKRFAGESSEQAFARYRSERLSAGFATDAGADTAYASRIAFDAIDASAVPEWDLATLTEVFEDIRDLRFLQVPTRPAFQRRISWLYPDDGCFARAALARHQIEDQWGKSLAKLFIFGNLRVATPNAPGGEVRWGWHVVPLVKIAGELYVIDPAIDPEQPLPADDWALRQVPRLEDAQFAVCKSFSYSPFSRCTGATADDESRAAADQQTYLGYEWSRITSLGRDPEKELGDLPPWLQ